MLREFKLKPRHHDPDIADLVLEAHNEFQRRGDGREMVRFVPLQLIHSPLHSCQMEDGSWLFVPVGGRSRKVQFGVRKP